MQYNDNGSALTQCPYPRMFRTLGGPKARSEGHGHFVITVAALASRAQKLREEYMRALVNTKVAIESKLGIIS